MPKLGLCACYSNHNFGSMLQALATCKAIDALEVEYELIRYKKKISPLRVVQIARKVITADAWLGLTAELKWRAYLSKHSAQKAKQELRSESFGEYCDRRFTKLSPVYEGYSALQDGSKKYDAVLVGSDQLWLPSGYSSGFYTLEFASEGVRRISYATSFGISSMPKSSAARAARFISKIDYLSVREKSGIEIVASVTGGDVKPKLVVDPTLLFDQAGWLNIVPEKRIVEGDYILCYFLGINPESRRMAAELKKRTGLPVVMLKDWRYHLDEDDLINDFDFYSANPDDFINLIRHANYVLTDSFHGTVFSLIHHKKFATFYRDIDGGNSINTRIDSLFSQLDLRCCLMDHADPGRLESLVVDFATVDESLDNWRCDSWNFLKEAVDGL